jgi:MOSC domain-containing protein YiiM
VVQVNVGVPATTLWQGREVTSSIRKQPVTGPVEVSGVNLTGDDQSDRRVHGGRFKAVYAYAVEDYAWWCSELGAEVGWGRFGENLTVRDIDLTRSVIGTRWRVGSVTLAVTAARFPCFKLGMAMGDAGFVPRFARARRPGAYLEIVDDGSLRADDHVEVGPAPDHGVTVGDMADAHDRSDRDAVRRLLTVPDLDPDWTKWAKRRLGHDH